MVYRWLRDLHLYLGLLVSPFVLLFAVSVFYLNHGKLRPGTPAPSEAFHDLQIPDGLDRLKGRAAIDLATRILPQLGLAGEIGFLRYVAPTRHLIFPVSIAGLESTVDVDLDRRAALVTRRRMTIWESLSYLHKMPGPHNVAIRGNWVGIRVWRWLADATLSLVLFISVSGIYLWWTIRAERRIGLTLAAAGIATLSGLVYAVIR